MSPSPRVVIDTNVLVSATRPGSVPRQALDRVLATGRLLVSEATLAEYNAVLRRPRLDRFTPEAERLDLLAALVEVAELVRITETVRACRDPDDDKLLELAVCGRATALVTGDDDLLALHPFRGVPILTPAAFLPAPPPPA